MFRDKSNSIDDICDTLKISRTTLYKYVSLQNIKDKRAGKTSE
ncbi:helix-turn-helix domain-containing protein [Gimesia maris]